MIERMSTDGAPPLEQREMDTPGTLPDGEAEKRYACREY